MCTGTDSCPGRVARVKTSAGLAEESETDRGSGLVVAVDGPSGAGKASAARAGRRAAEASWSTQAEVDRRDRMDAAQSGKAADAVEVDSTELDLDGVVGVIVGLVPKPLQKSR